MSNGKIRMIVALWWAVYGAGAFLTAAYYDQHIYTPCRAAELSDPVRIPMFSNCGATPFIGMVWPGYWAWRGALAVTK